MLNKPSISQSQTQLQVRLIAFSPNGSGCSVVIEIGPMIYELSSCLFVPFLGNRNLTIQFWLEVLFLGFSTVFNFNLKTTSQPEEWIRIINHFVSRVGCRVGGNTVFNVFIFIIICLLLIYDLFVYIDYVHNTHILLCCRVWFLPPFEISFLSKLH